MSSTPLLRVINLSIAVLVVALLAALYWYAWRPLPETSGQIVAPISAKATISRDALGVPHISAGSWEDAIFLQGYATAQDRMWQMDAIRRLAAGELAEVVGKQAVDSDQESRRLRLARIADENQRSLPAADRVVLAAYARGVNYYLEKNRGRLPLEFSILNYDPRPWTIRDSLLAGLEMYRTLTSSWRLDLNKSHMLEQGDPAKVEFLFPQSAASAVQPGSNAWAISGALSANGKPILASDPHLEFAIPETWYLVHLQAPGLNVSGASIPGLPAVIIGHNERIAWGVTNLQFDVQDLYREQIDPRSGRYFYRGQAEQAVLEREAIAVKGGKPFELLSWVTRHGPVFLTDENKSYSLRWVAATPKAAEFSFLDLNRANNWPEFTAALARFPGPGQNFVYADVDGNIGYHATGLLPIRKNLSRTDEHERTPHESPAHGGAHCAGDVPVDGAAGDCEWDGFIPFDELPQSYNPASGVIESSNQNPFPPDYGYPVSGNFASPDRARQVRSLLGSQAKWRPEEMLRIQKDVYSALANFLAHQAVAAWDANQAANPQLRDAVDVLRAWNGQMEKGSAPMLTALLLRQLRRAIAERAAPGHGEAYESTIPTAITEKLMRERPPEWFANYDQLLLKSMSQAIDEGAKTQGSKVSRWDYGQYSQLRILHPIGGQIPILGKYFNIGPVSMSGSPATVKQITPRLGPSMRMVVDFADLDNSLQNLAVGESGQWLSSHYKDQWDAYYVGRSFPMQFRKVEAKKVLLIDPVR